MDLKKEAIKRLNKLKMSNEVVNAFVNEDKLYYSERMNMMFPATLYYLENEKKYVEMVKEFEKKTGYKVYHVIKTYTSFGEILDFLFVSTYKEDWKYELEDTKHNTFIAMSMANNLTDESCSDMGSIEVRPVMGGLERIA